MDKDDYYWKQRDGTIINIKDMATEHIKRCFKYLSEDSEWHKIFNNELYRREKEIKVGINDDSLKISVNIGLSRMPDNCGECPLYFNNPYYDEDAFFGSGIIYRCPFDCSIFGCLVERPADCPLTIRN